MNDQINQNQNNIKHTVTIILLLLTVYMWKEGKEGIVNIMRNILNISYKTKYKYLGRWSSSISKKQWKMYADFANYDNCCCSFTNVDTSQNKTLNSSIRSSSHIKSPDIKP